MSLCPPPRPLSTSCSERNKQQEDPYQEEVRLPDLTSLRPLTLDSVPYHTRPVNLDDGPEDIKWIRGLLVGGGTLPAASYALFPKAVKGHFFAIGADRRGIEIWSPVFI